MNRGWLIAFEGIDGSGKSTQLAALACSLRAAGREVETTREPTEGPFGQRIRSRAREIGMVDPGEELRWFIEDRREHVERTIRPALAAGRVVLTDRYFLSTVAYQGARGLDPLRLLEQSEAEFPLPDLALLLEVDPRQALARVRASGRALEARFETPEFLARVAEIFASIERPYVARIDAGGDFDEVAAAVRQSVRDRLALL